MSTSKLYKGLGQWSSTFLSSCNPWYTFAFVMEPPLKKFKKHELLVRKSNISLLDISTNKQLLQKLRSKKFNDSAVLAFLECSCYIQNLAIRQKEPVYLKYVSTYFLTWAIELHLVRFGWGASFTFVIHCSLPSTPSLLLLFRFT